MIMRKASMTLSALASALLITALAFSGWWRAVNENELRALEGQIENVEDRLISRMRAAAFLMNAEGRSASAASPGLRARVLAVETVGPARERGRGRHGGLQRQPRGPRPSCGTG